MCLDPLGLFAAPWNVHWLEPISMSLWNDRLSCHASTLNDHHVCASCYGWSCGMSLTGVVVIPGSWQHV